MRRQGRSGWILVVAATLGLVACVVDEDEPESIVGGVPMYVGAAGSAVDAGLRVCEPGETQLCHGPGACEGAQRCELHGLSWGPCDCGDSGSGGAGSQPIQPTAGGDPGEGGAAGGDTADGRAHAPGIAGAGAASLCSDGVMNGTESDVDCGGALCAPCPELSNCVVGTDCASDHCVAGVCVYPTCEDGVPNGDETDVDCGGGTCPVCAAGMGCQTGADCDSGRCTDGVCEAS